MKINIRKICVGLLVAALVVIPVAAYAGEGTPQRAKGLFADLVILDANIITMDVENPMYEESSRAEALAVRDGKIVAVGDTSQIFAKYVGSDTEVIDAEGKTVTPGFNDSHLHPKPVYTAGSPHYIVPLGPADMEQTMDALIATLSAQADVMPTGEWVRGARYEDTKLGRHPTRWDLDQVSTDHFICITHSSGHVSVVNSLCIETSGITKDIEDPPGGSFGRDPVTGELTGVCYEGPARDLAIANCPPYPTPTDEEYKEGMILCFENFLSDGLTTIGDASTNSAKLGLYVDLMVEERLPIRVNTLLREGPRWGWSTMLDRLKELNLKTGFGNDMLQMGPLKIMSGNSLSGRTCWLYEPYVGSYEGADPPYYGIPPGRSQEDLNELVLAAHEAGFQFSAHVNGDREIAMFLDAIQYALDESPRENHRHRLEHASIMTPELLQRCKDLEVVLALHSYTYDHGDKFVDYGPDRWPWMHANKSALELGIVVCGNSDFGVSAADPMLRIQSLVTRATAEGVVYGPEQKLTPDQAIWTWTVGSAYASFEEDIKGSIEIGKLADIVILSDDPNKVDPFEIKDIEVVMTILGGEIVYES